MKKFLSCIMITIILLIIFILKGIYPFGTMTIIHADLGQIFVNNFCYYINSIRSGNLYNFLYCNLLYAGTNFLGSALPSGFFSPFSIIYLLCLNYKKLVYFSSIILIIKIGLSAITSYICFEKLFGKENYLLNTIFSMEYALSSYVLINYTTILWLDIIILFPLLVLAFKRILEGKGFFYYTILLSSCLIIHYQIVYMILFSILATIMFILKKYNKEKRKDIICNLGIGTFLGLTIPAVIFLPCIKIYLESYRLEITEQFENTSTFVTKLSYLLFSGISLYGCCMALKHVKKDENVKLLIISIIFTGIIPIFFEGVNEIWHGGKYDCFPFRYGFIPLFFINILANYYYKEYLQNDFKNSNYKMDKISCIIFLIILLCLIISICNLVSVSNPAFKTDFKTVLILIIYNAIIFHTLHMLFSEYSKYANIIIAIFAIVEILIFSYAHIGINEEYRGGNVHSDISLFNGIEIIEELDNKLDYTSGYKYKDEGLFMLENTSLLTNLPSISSWILSKQEQVQTHINLGYSLLHLRLNSIGGTILSDSILNVRYVFSGEDLDTSLYTYLGKTSSGIKLYEYKNYFPIGIVYNSEGEKNIIDTTNKFDYQNTLYKNLFNKSDNIIETLDAEDIMLKDELGENDFIEYNINIKDRKALYFYSEEKTKSMAIEVNDQLVNVPTGLSTTEYYYPSDYNNGILNFGVYENEVVNVKIYFCDLENYSYFKFATLDLNKYENLFTNLVETEYQYEKNKINISVNVEDDDKSIFIPVTYDENWIIKLNGKTVNADRYLDSFISIDLEKGTNNIELIFENKTIKLGMIISIISTIGFACITIFRNKILKLKLIQNIMYVLFYLIIVIFYLVVYIGGVILTFI